MNKKAIAILGAIFLLIVGTLGFLIYSKYSGTSEEEPPLLVEQPERGLGSAGSSTSPSLPPPVPGAQASGIYKLSDDQVVSPVLFFNGRGVSYFDRQGNLFLASFQDNSSPLVFSEKKQLGIPAKANISKILWPAKGNDFIAQIKNPMGGNSWSYFNSNTGVYTDLPSQVVSVDWMPSGQQIMYVWLENNKASLSLGNPDTTNYQTLADMWETDNILNVSPYGDQVLYYQDKFSSPANPINSVTADGKVWKGLVKTGQNYGVLWSPDNQKFLFAKKDTNTQKYQLWVYNLSSGEVKNLNLSTTVDKAVWDKDSNVIYAAVPASGAPGENSLTVDDLVRIDTATLNKKQYGPNAASIDGRDLFLSSTSDKLFFRNAQDGALYYLDLAQ
jgi:hypothetical protein